MKDKKVLSYITFSELNEPHYNDGLTCAITDERVNLVCQLHGRPMTDDDVEPMAFNGYRAWMQELGLDPTVPVIMVTFKTLTRLAERFNLPTVSD
jgi:hypothetical protein